MFVSQAHTDIKVAKRLSDFKKTGNIVLINIGSCIAQNRSVCRIIGGEPRCGVFLAKFNTAFPKTDNLTRVFPQKGDSC